MSDELFYDSYTLNHTVNAIHPRNFFLGQHIISDQISRDGLAVIWRELENILLAERQGDIVELGCYVGTTSLYIRRQLDRYRQSEARAFHVYDSFEGLPDKARQDVSAKGIDFKAGSLQVSKKELLLQFKRANLKPPMVHKNWFNQLTTADLPKNIAFAFLDGDLYYSIIDSLRLVWPRLNAGGAILIDDYKHDALPGVERAVTDFFQGKQYRLRAEQNIAIITA